MSLRTVLVLLHFLLPLDAFLSPVVAFLRFGRCDTLEACLSVPVRRNHPTIQSSQRKICTPKMLFKLANLVTATGIWRVLLKERRMHLLMKVVQTCSNSLQQSGYNGFGLRQTWSAGWRRLRRWSFGDMGWRGTTMYQLRQNVLHRALPKSNVQLLIQSVDHVRVATALSLQ